MIDRKKTVEAEEIYKDSKRMWTAFDLAMKEIEDVLSRKKHPTDLTRMAAAVVSSYSRIKTTEIHNKALELVIARKDLKAIPFKPEDE